MADDPYKVFVVDYWYIKYLYPFVKGTEINLYGRIIGDVPKTNGWSMFRHRRCGIFGPIDFYDPKNKVVQIGRNRFQLNIDRYISTSRFRPTAKDEYELLEEEIPHKILVGVMSLKTLTILRTVQIGYEHIPGLSEQLHEEIRCIKKDILV